VQLPLFQVDAFTSRLFAGNPAAVVPLDRWLPEDVMQAIALENNLSETAFTVPAGEAFELRWFTPTVEVDLCGHATLAAAWVLLEEQLAAGDEVRFTTRRSGPLVVRRDGQRLALDFPAAPPEPAACTSVLVEALGARPREVHQGQYLLAVFDGEREIRALRPDQAALAALDALAVSVTASGDEVDFVSRLFAPRAGVPEDPVTGSAHCTLVPYWSARLGRSVLVAHQVSARGGELFCEDRGERVIIAGSVTPYLRGTITIPDSLS
jgi:PhzF family phenazine biosynthesis protein